MTHMSKEKLNEEVALFMGETIDPCWDYIGLDDRGGDIMNKLVERSITFIVEHSDRFTAKNYGGDTSSHYSLLPGWADMMPPVIISESGTTLSEALARFIARVRKTAHPRGA